MGAGAVVLIPSSADFPGVSKELDQRWSSYDLNQCPSGMFTLNPLQNNVSPGNVFLFSKHYRGMKFSQSLHIESTLHVIQLFRYGYYSLKLEDIT